MWCSSSSTHIMEFKIFVKFAGGHTRLTSGNKLATAKWGHMISPVETFISIDSSRIWNALIIINYQENLFRTKNKLLAYGISYTSLPISPLIINPCFYIFSCPCSKCSKIPHQPNFNFPYNCWFPPPLTIDR